jgi:serine/threonine protein phosphatase Stp1
MTHADAAPVISRTLHHWSASHAGTVRVQNQDSSLCYPELGLFAVADGVGGIGDGAIASAMVVRNLAELPKDLVPKARLPEVRARLQATHRMLLAKGARQIPPTGLATTIVVLLIHEDHFAVLWAGDSRCYLLREGIFYPLTSDHSVVQEMIDSGTITEVDADIHPDGHIITRAMGFGDEDLLLDKVVGTVRAGDRFLLCSDGLYKTVRSKEIADLLGRDDNIAESLIKRALSGHARDNITAVVADVGS